MDSVTVKQAKDFMKEGIKWSHINNFTMARANFICAEKCFRSVISEECGDQGEHHAKEEIKTQIKFCEKMINKCDCKCNNVEPTNFFEETAEKKTDFRDKIFEKSDELSKKKPITFTDVCGYKEQKDLLKVSVVMAIKYPQLFSEEEVSNGVLLYGPPGTGKSYFARALAGECPSATFYSISAADMTSQWYGQSEKQVRQLFQTARLKKPSIIFMDEIDSLTRCRSGNDDETSRRVKNELLYQMDGTLESNDGVFLIGATNMPYELDTAFLRRFKKRIYLPLPDEQARIALFQQRFVGYDWSDEQLEILASKTKGYAASDIDEICENTKLKTKFDLLSCKFFRKIQATEGSIVLYTPCDESDNGAIEMDCMEVPDGCMHFSRRIQFDDVLRTLQESKPASNESSHRLVQKFADENTCSNHRDELIDVKQPWTDFFLSCFT